MTTIWPEQTAKSTRVDGGGLRILIVDDCADTTTSMAMLLRMYGHDVQIAMNGIEALKKAQNDRPDVILLDIGLPGMSGYEVARTLKGQSSQQAPFLIAMTGYGQEEDRRQSAEAGIDLHLLKPVDPDELQGILQRHQRQMCN